MLSKNAKGQLCSGSLGDPVVNITFGTGNTNPSNIPGFNTDYTYLTSSCPNDGQYTIASISPSCYGGAWWTLSGDHTPNDVNGNMMIVNASYNPGDFFVDTVSGLCNGVTYEFAAWLLNLVIDPNSIHPNITFTIETTTGTVIQQYKTGDVPTTAGTIWNQYGFFFAAPANSGRIVLRMRNNAPGGIGNDLVIDDITFRPCGPKVTAIISTGFNIINTCADDTTHYTFTGNASAGFNNIHYQWQVSTDSGKSWKDIVGAITNSYTLTSITAGNYQYRLTVAEGTSISINDCRIASDVISFNKEALPLAGIKHQYSACFGDSVHINANTANTYQWIGPSFFYNFLPAFTIKNLSNKDSGWYRTRIVSKSGCVSTDSFYLTINKIPVGTAIGDTSICEGESVILKGSGGTNYLWKPATNLNNHATDSIITITPLDSIMYTLLVSNGVCYDSQTVHINVWKKPTVIVGNAGSIHEGESVTLDGIISGTDLFYYWKPTTFITNNNSPNPTVYPDTSTTYYLVATSTHNCGVAIDSVFIKVFKQLHIPNAFSPNGDGKHEFWKIGNSLSYPKTDVMIFERGGTLLYKASGNFVQWDGKVNGQPLPIGTYYYIIDPHENQPVYSGWLQIVK